LEIALATLWGVTLGLIVAGFIGRLTWRRTYFLSRMQGRAAETGAAQGEIEDTRRQATPSKSIFARAEEQRRVQQAQRALTRWLRALGGALEAGMSLSQGVRESVASLPSPLKEELERVVQAMDVGVPLGDALGILAQRLPTPETQLMVSAVIMNSMAGGNLVEVLYHIAATIDERISMQNEINALTAQGRLSGVIVGSLPVVLFIFLTISNPGYMAPLVTTGAGRIMIALSILLLILGAVTIRAFIRIDV
jgi:tight adherence protein B